MLLATLLLASSLTGAPQWEAGPCNGWYSTPSPSDHNVPAQVRALITCAERRFPVAAGLGTVLAISDRESGLSPWARNPSSGACGAFQSMPSLWPARARSLPERWFPAYLQPLSCFNARANVLWAVRSMSHDGLGPWGG